jgi:hypothetical protein
MNRKELEYIEQILSRVKDQDDKVARALALVRKDIACYQARRGQLRESYEADLHDLRGW